MKNLSSTMASSSGCPFASMASEKNTASSAADSDETSKDAASATVTATATTCPFAQTLHTSTSTGNTPHHDSNSNSNSNSYSDDISSSSSMDLSAASTMMSSPPSSLSLAWKECPVFANHSCPFKDAKSPDEVSQILNKMQLPASHTDQMRNSAVLNTIETLDAYFHTNRDQAMEGYSLSAIMSRLAREHHHNEHDDELDDELDDRNSDEFRLPQPTPETTGNSDNHNSIINSNSNSNTNDQDQQSPQQGQQHRRLSEALKTGTEEAHKEAESVHFVKNFIRGKIDRRLYALFVAQMFHVYQSLEQALDEHAPNHFVDCHFPNELSRCKALQEDIDFWGQGSTSTTISGLPPISPATQDYLDRIETVSKERPLLLLAHAYTRYLGDLSGGKILARVAKKAMHLDSSVGPDGLTTTEGLAFYDFPLLRGGIKAFKDRYRQALNDLQFDDIDEAVQAVVQEANVAFLLNMRLFEELDVIGNVPGASIRPLEQVYSHVAKMNDENKGEEEQQQSQPPAPCPFANMSSGASASFQNLHQHHHSQEQGQDEQNKQKQEHEQTQNSSHIGEGKICPWPFLLLHDPNAGMRKWQTWFTIGLLLTFAYQQYINFNLVVVV